MNEEKVVETVQIGENIFDADSITPSTYFDYVKELKNKDYKILGTNVTNGIDARESKTYSHFALIIGNEGRGMSQELEKYCDEYLYIKMNDNCESLNASVAASILMYELDRH